MSRNTKQLLMILGVAVVFCLVAVAAAIGSTSFLANRFKDNIVTDPEKIRQMAHGFVDYQLPPSYTEQLGMDLLVYKMVLINSRELLDRKPMIFMAHFQADGLSAEQMTEQVRESVEQQSGSRGLTLEVVETRTVTINGHETSLAVSEGIDGSGDIHRQWVTTFPGKTGLVLLLIQGEVAGWDDAVFNEFLSSIDS